MAQDVPEPDHKNACVRGGQPLQETPNHTVLLALLDA
jgi:hypothetical protein